MTIKLGALHRYLGTYRYLQVLSTSQLLGIPGYRVQYTHTDLQLDDCMLLFLFKWFPFAI